MLRDLRYAWRSLRRVPVVAAVVVSSLAVGIGVNTVVFSWIQRVVFRPVAGVPDAGAFHLLEPRTESGGYPGASWLEYRDLRATLHGLEQLLAFRMAPLYVGEPGRVERGSGMLVSENYFDALRLAPAAGRFFAADEASTPGQAPVAVISDAFWQTRFARRADAVGRRLRVNGQDLTIVGVAPPGFRGTVLGLSFDMWLPATMAPVLFEGSKELDERGARGYSILGTLAPGTSRDQAQHELDSAMRGLERTYLRSNAGIRAEVLPFWQAPRGPQRFLAASLGLLQAIMLLVLLTVCGNTATLVLARASARQGEMSIRLALGAPRWRIASLLLTESVLLAMAGAAAGAVLAAWGMDAMSALPPMRVRGIPISLQTEVNATGLVFAAGLGLACGLLFGAAPAIQLSRIDAPGPVHGATTTAPRSRLRNALMATEVSLALVALIAAGLFFESFMATRGADTGFRRDGMLLAEYDLTPERADAAASLSFARRLLDRLRALPGVDGAALATSVPLDIHGMGSASFAVDGRRRTDGVDDEALVNVVTPGYFETMAIPIVSGRDFSPLESTPRPGEAAEAIVNQSFVKAYIAPAEPLGRGVVVRGRTYRIVGVMRDSLYSAFGEGPTPAIYFSFRDRPSPIGEIHLHAAAGPPAGLAAGLRAAVRDLDPELPVYDVRTLDEHVEANLVFRRVPARMFAVIGPLLLILAAIGIYAVVAYAASLRTAEVGVRLALGATAGQVVGQFMRETLTVVAAGALIGWVFAFVLVLDVVSGSVDARVFAGVPLLLLTVAAIATWIPARRAARLDPVTALRHA
jgi:predicted permease